MWMIELRDRARFTVEALAELRIDGEGFWQNFDRDGPIQASVAGFINLAHAAHANGSKNLVRAEANADAPGQTAVDYTCGPANAVAAI